MATELARMGVPEALRTRVMGWRDPQTAKIYTHMVPTDEELPLEELGRRMPVADIIGAPKKPWGRPEGLAKSGVEIAQEKARPRVSGSGSRKPRNGQ